MEKKILPLNNENYEVLVQKIKENFSESNFLSKEFEAKYINTLIHALNRGDQNPIHINPITAKKYKTILNGKLARHGISTISQAEAQIFDVMKFDAEPEIISLGYDKIRYPSPVNIGDKLSYEYELGDIKPHTIREGTAESKNGLKIIRKVKTHNHTQNTISSYAERIAFLSKAEEDKNYRNNIEYNKQNIQKAAMGLGIIALGSGPMLSVFFVIMDILGYDIPAWYNTVLEGLSQAAG